MNTSAFANGGLSTFDFLNFDVVASSSQDADLVKQFSFIPGLKEILMLRQVHALEHGTVWILSQSNKSQSNKGRWNKNQLSKNRSNNLRIPSSYSSQVQMDNELLGGLSTEQGFYIYGDVNISNLRRAATLALHRLVSGESNLALHPRCSTNVSVEVLLTAGLAVGMHLILPRGPIEQLIGLGIATTTASEIAPDIGFLAQKYLTTAIPFNLAIENVTWIRDSSGREAHFVKVCWRE